MNRIILLGIVLFSFVTSSGQLPSFSCLPEAITVQNDPQNLARNMVLKRTIWKYRIIDGILTRDKERLAIDTYLSSGKLSETACYKNDDDVMDVLVFQYNKQLQLMKQSLFDPLGNVLEYWDYVYDNNGNLVQIIHKSSDNTIVERETYQYLYDVNVAKQIRFDGSDLVLETIETFYSDLDTGVVMKQVFYGPKSKILHVKKSLYDDGRLLSVNITNAQGVLTDSLQYDYTPENLLSEIKKLSPRKEILERKVYQYDINQLLMGYSEYGNQGKMLRFYRFTYAYF